jgi:hypothetical protein
MGAKDTDFARADRVGWRESAASSIPDTITHLTMQRIQREQGKPDE